MAKAMKLKPKVMKPGARPAEANVGIGGKASICLAPGGECGFCQRATIRGIAKHNAEGPVE
jgi:hypothetical protein